MFIEELGEFGLIQRIKERFPSTNNSVLLAIGDDAALFKPTKEKSILVTTDTLREGIHFKKRYATAFDIGWKAVAVSLSDIAAMGGVPKYLLLSLGIPGNISSGEIETLLDGIGQIMKRYNISLIGGNVSFSIGGLTVDTTLIGEVEKGKSITRGGASPGDLIYVTGVVGKSAIGHVILESHGNIKKEKNILVPFISSHLRPNPRIREGEIIGSNRLATAMIDISDGLLSDLAHLCEQSRVGALVYSNLIPLPVVPEKLYRLLYRKPLHYALYGGEDYELLFTVKKQNRTRLEETCKKEQIDITCIGEVVPQDKGISMINETGKNVYNAGGYDHFKNKRGMIC